MCCAVVADGSVSREGMVRVEREYETPYPEASLVDCSKPVCRVGDLRSFERRMGVKR